MARRVESVHKMTLRGRGQRRPASMESVGCDELDTATVDRDQEQQSYPDLDTDTHKGEGATVATDADPFKVECSCGSIARQSFLLVIISTFFVLLLHQIVFTECDKEELAGASTKSLQDLSEQYPQHKSFWKAVSVSIRMCTKSTKPGVMLVLYNGNGSIAECLVNCTASQLPRLVNVSEFSEYGYVDGKNALQVYNPDSFLPAIMKQRTTLGVLVFNNLEEMDLELVKNLHFICDSDPHIPNKSVIILMLRAEVPIFIDNELDNLANNKLAELWEEKLGSRYMPIIGRITNNLGYIDENIATKCP